MNLWHRLLMIGFRLLYYEMAWTYDAISWIVSLGQWREWQRAAVPFLTGHDVLELAHGPGHMLVELEPSGYHPVGLDLSPYMGRMAARRVNEANINVPLVRGQAQTLPFRTAAFDSILATFPTAFILEPETINELYRILRPAGRLVIVAEARLTGGGLIRGFIEWLYTITGQRQGSKDEQEQGWLWLETKERFAAGGFNLQMESIKLEHSEVGIAIAEKRGFRP